MAETFLTQIEILRTALQAASTGEFHHKYVAALTGRELENTQDLGEKLTSLHIALVHNIAHNVENNQSQIAMALEFARQMSFFGREFLPDRLSGRRSAMTMSR